MGGNAGQTPRNERERLRAMVDERRARVASLKVQGFSVRQIQQALERDGHRDPKTGQSWGTTTVQRDLTALDALWKAQAAQSFDAWVRMELAKIDEVERQAWEAWHRGIGKRQSTVSEHTTVADDGGRKSGGRDRKKAKVITEELNGDPRYLQVIADCQRDRANLLGLNAPKRTEVTGKGGGPIEVKEARSRLLARIAARLGVGGERAGQP